MTGPNTNDAPENSKLIAVALDEASIARVDPKIDHERQVAIFDILENNTFQLKGHETKGPFRLQLSLEEDRLVFEVKDEAELYLDRHDMSLMPFRRILKDYFLVLESYYQAVNDSQPAKIEAIDVGRRGLHDEGSQILLERLGEKFVIDFATARRLFTLLAALHWKG